MVNLPLEIFYEIAKVDVETYRNLLKIPFFATSLTPSSIEEFKRKFGIKKDDRTEWRRNGILHRIDGPAIEWKNGKREWYQNGELHRIDGPAIEHPNGDNEWYENGEIYRVDAMPIIINKKVVGYRGGFLILKV